MKLIQILNLMLNSYLNIKSDFIRFAIVGIVSTLVNFFIYILFASIVNLEIFLSSIIGYSSGLFVSYHFGRTWVFKNIYNANIKNVFLFLLVYLVGGVGMGLIITYLVDVVSIEYRLSWFIGVTFAAMNNYFGLKLYVFNKK